MQDGTQRPEATREYRIEELAQAAGSTVRTLRYYQERRLLPPPRREGRVGIYTEAHLARLRVIAQLLERGHTLDGVRELLTAWEKGRDVADLLGLEEAITASWSADSTVEMSWTELAAAYSNQVTPETVGDGESLGYIRPHPEDPELVTFTSARLLETSSALVREGIPLTAVMGASRRLQPHVDALAQLFIELVREHILGDFTNASTEELAALEKSVERLRPVAMTTIEAEFGRAMDRRVADEFGDLISQLDTMPGPEPGGSQCQGDEGA